MFLCWAELYLQHNSPWCFWLSLSWDLIFHLCNVHPTVYHQIFWETEPEIGGEDGWGDGGRENIILPLLIFWKNAFNSTEKGVFNVFYRFNDHIYACNKQTRNFAWYSIFLCKRHVCVNSHFQVGTQTALKPIIYQGFLISNISWTSWLIIVNCCV